VASGPDQPPAGPPRLADRLARHRWVAAAGMTATIAAVAGGGFALALHDSSPGPPKECGLVPCAAALPASVQASGNESASAPAATAPTAAQPATPPGPGHSAAPPAASAPAPGAAPPDAGPPAGWPVTAERVSVPEPRVSCTTVIAFTARGTLSAPVRCTFTDAVLPQRSRDGSAHPGPGAAGLDSDRAGRQLRPGRSSHHGWLGNWLSDWLSRGSSGGGWSGSGWPGGGGSGGGWSGGGWSGGGWSGSGRPGQHGGWPGGR
jgi:hypothetical protein